MINTKELKEKLDFILSDDSDIQRAHIVFSNSFEIVIVSNINFSNIKITVSIHGGINIELNRHEYADTELLHSFLINKNLKEDKLNLLAKKIYNLMIQNRDENLLYNRNKIALNYCYQKTG